MLNVECSQFLVSNVVTAPTDDGTTKTVIVNPPTGSRFYRLFKP